MKNVFTPIENHDKSCQQYRNQNGDVWTLGFDLGRAFKTKNEISTGKQLAATMPEAKPQSVGNMLRAVIGG